MKYHRWIPFLIGFLGVISANAEQKASDPLVPMAFVSGFMKDYSPEEQALIHKDLANIEDLIFYGKTPETENQSAQYVATAGGPGVGKSTILERYLKGPDHQNYVYVDPDPQALRYMMHTYLQTTSYGNVTKDISYPQLVKKGYEKWRAASNYIAHTLMNKAAKRHYNIAHGTTSSSPKIVDLYKGLKARGYKITLLLCGAPDEGRKNALEHRVRVHAFYQSTPEDEVSKGKAFFERIPIYFEYADVIEIYWSQDVLQGARKAAILHKGKKAQILDALALKAFEKMYENQAPKNLPLAQLMRDFEKVS